MTDADNGDTATASIDAIVIDRPRCLTILCHYYNPKFTQTFRSTGIHVDHSA